MSGFDPARHRLVPEQRWFEDFTLGERFVLPSRTMTEALFLAFQAASGDNHPIHYDREFCRARGMPQMLAHGFQTLIQTAPGAGLFPYLAEDSLIGFLEQSSRFLKPVFAGDTLYPLLEIAELTPRRTSGVVGLRSSVHNQRARRDAAFPDPPPPIRLNPDPYYEAHDQAWRGRAARQGPSSG